MTAGSMVPALVATVSTVVAERGPDLSANPSPLDHALGEHADDGRDPTLTPDARVRLFASTPTMQ